MTVSGPLSPGNAGTVDVGGLPWTTIANILAVDGTFAWADDFAPSQSSNWLIAGGFSQDEDWSYQIIAPTPPVTTSTVNLSSPSVATIQSNIAAGKKIVITGTVSAITTQLTVSVDDVWLDFSGADLLTWAGSDTDDTFFIQLSGQRIRLTGLEFNGDTGGIGGLRISPGSNRNDYIIEDCLFDGCYRSEILAGERLRIDNSDFINSPASALSTSSGYGLWLSGTSTTLRDVEVSNCTFSTAANANEYPLRMAATSQNVRFIDCVMERAGGTKRVTWLYGCTNLQLTRCTFRDRRVRLGSANAIDGVGNHGLHGVRIDACVFEDSVAAGPNEGVLAIVCAGIGEDVLIRGCTWTNCDQEWMLVVEWRDSGDLSQDINWWPDSMEVDAGTFDAGHAFISDDWSAQEAIDANIAPISGDPGSGFAIPSGAVISGIEVTVHRKASIAEGDQAHIRDVTIRLMPDGETPEGDNKADTVTNWTTTVTSATYGDPNDLWGLTITPEDLNAGTFAVLLVCRWTQTIFVPAGFKDAFVDSIQLTVYYRGGSSTYTATADLTLPAIEFAGESPLSRGEAELTLPAIAFAGTAEFTKPVFSASAALTLPAIQFESGQSSATGVNLTRWLEDESFAFGVL